MIAAAALARAAALLLATAPEIEEFTPAPATPSVSAQEPEAFAPAAAAPIPRLFGGFRALLGVDTRFDPPPDDAFPENVVELRGRVNLGADVKLSEHLRAVVEGRALWRGVAQAGLRRAKAYFEPQVGEAFVDLYTPRVDVRLGNQVFAAGANPALAPADALNPRDLRESLLLGEPEDAKLPVFAVRAQGEVASIGWSAAYVPFFEPHRYTVFGEDESLIQPGWGVAPPAVLERIDPSIEDALQPHLLETKRPKAFGYLGDLALRVTTEVKRVKLGASWVWMNEKLPQVRIDPELNAVLTRTSAGGTPSPAELLSLQQRFQAGEALYTGTYGRQHLFSLEGSVVVGPAQLDVDVTYSPAQTFYDERLQPVRLPAVTWVVGVTQAEDSPWLYSVTYVGLAVPGVKADQQLALIEPATARGKDRTAWLHLLVGVVSRKLFDDRLDVGLRAAYEPIQGSFALGPRVAYRPWDRWTFSLAAEVYQGSPFSPLGYYGRNDQLLAGVSAELF